MTLAKLQELIDSGNFHHATYRNQGTLWEGLWIYEKETTNKFNGFRPTGSFAKDDPCLEEAYALVRHTGVSVGHFGGG